MFSPIKTLAQLYLYRRPFLLNQKINIACDCRCKFCNTWQIKEEPESLLDRAETQSLIDRAARAGMLSYSMWGGEPLLREDAPAIMAHARKQGFFTTISTNGSLLRDRADELLPHTTLFLVSLDGIGKTHDQVRGSPGLFDKVVDGIGFLRSRGGRVRIFYNVNTTTAPDVAESARLARDLGVSIFFYPMVKNPGYNDRLVLEGDSHRETFDLILRLKSEGFPVINLAGYLKVIREDVEFPLYRNR